MYLTSGHNEQNPLNSVYNYKTNINFGVALVCEDMYRLLLVKKILTLKPV